MIDNVLGGGLEFLMGEDDGWLNPHCTVIMADKARLLVWNPGMSAGGSWGNRLVRVQHV